MAAASTYHHEFLAQQQINQHNIENIMENTRNNLTKKYLILY